MASHDPLNDPRPGDQGNNLLRKILSRLSEGEIQISPAIELAPGDVNIGSVTIKDADGPDQVDVETSTPTADKAGLVTRNIPSGTQTVDGTVNVGNFPATQPVSGTVNVGNFPATQVVSNPTDVSNPQFDAARVGTVAGKAAYTFHVMGRRAGFNSTSVLQDVGEWLGTSINALPELTGAENLEVVSSSANDTAAGTGTRTVRVGYIDTSNNLVVSADITMNGTTPVALAFKANFILWMETSTVGSGEVAAGNIILRIAGAGATHEQITAGGNRSLSCRFMVPTGWTGYLVDWGVWSIGTTQDSRLRATVRTFSRALGTAYLFQSVAYVGAGASSSEELHYVKIPALAKLKVSTIAGAAAASNRIDAEFTILLVQD